MKKGVLIVFVAVAIFAAVGYWDHLSRSNNEQLKPSSGSELISHSPKKGGDFYPSEKGILVDKISTSEITSNRISYQFPANRDITRIEASFFECVAYDRIQEDHLKKLEEIKKSFRESTFSNEDQIRQLEMKRDKELRKIEMKLHDETIKNNAKKTNIYIENFPEEEGYVIIKTHIRSSVADEALESASTDQIDSLNKSTNENDGISEVFMETINDKNMSPFKKYALQLEFWADNGDNTFQPFNSLWIKGEDNGDLGQFDPGMKESLKNLASQLLSREDLNDIIWKKSDGNKYIQERIYSEFEIVENARGNLIVKFLKYDQNDNYE